MMPQQLGLLCHMSEAQGLLRIADSPAFKAYVQALQDYDQALLQRLDCGQLPIKSLLLEHSLDTNQLNLIHLTRIWLKYCPRWRCLLMKRSWSRKACMIRFMIAC